MYYVHNIIFILFKIISDLKMMKEEIAKENAFLTELLNLEAAPTHQEINSKESASAEGKLNPS